MAWTPPTYPKELTDKWWQSNKGLVAKIATKDSGTGLGKQLTALQTAFAKLKFDKIDFAQKAPGHMGSRTAQDRKDGIANAQAQAKAAKIVSDQAHEVRQAAERLAAAWKNEKMIPKASVDTCLKVATAAKTLSYALATGTLSDVVAAGVKEEEAAYKRNQEILRKAVAGVPAKLEALVQDARNGVTVEGWKSFWSQNVRFIGTQLVNVQKLHPLTAPEVQALRKHTSTCNPVSDQKVLDGWLQELTAAAGSMRRKMG